DGLAGVDGGAVDAVVHLAGDGSGQLALTLVEALLRGEHRVVQGRAGQRDTGCARDEPEVDAARRGLRGERLDLLGREVLLRGRGEPGLPIEELAGEGGGTGPARGGELGALALTASGVGRAAAGRQGEQIA